MRLSIGRHLVLLLPLCCVCFASVHQKSETEEDNGIVKKISSNRGMRQKPKDTFGWSANHPSMDPKVAGILCPDAEAIAPCVCSVDTELYLYLDCTLVESDEQLAAVFQQEFPVKQLSVFYMAQNSAITLFSSFMNGITFQEIYLEFGPFVLEGISDELFLDLKDTLLGVWISDSQIQTEFFPFHLLPLMKIESLYLGGSHITHLPQMLTPIFGQFGVEYSPIEILSEGTIRLGSATRDVALSHNQIHTIEPGSIFFDIHNMPRPGIIWFYLGYNQLETVDEAVFGDVMPFFRELYLVGNPLTCGCDIAWLVLNDAYLSIIDDEATCVNGTNLADLNPQDYLDLCRS